MFYSYRVSYIKLPGCHQITSSLAFSSILQSCMHKQISCIATLSTTCVTFPDLLYCTDLEVVGHFCLTFGTFGKFKQQKFQKIGREYFRGLLKIYETPIFSLESFLPQKLVLHVEVYSQILSNMQCLQGFVICGAMVVRTML